MNKLQEGQTIYEDVKKIMKYISNNQHYYKLAHPKEYSLDKLRELYHTFDEINNFISYIKNMFYYHNLHSNLYSIFELQYIEKEWEKLLNNIYINANYDNLETII